MATAATETKPEFSTPRRHFCLTDEHEALRESIETFCDRELAPHSHHCACRMNAMNDISPAREVPGTTSAVRPPIVAPRRRSRRSRCSASPR